MILNYKLYKINYIKKILIISMKKMKMKKNTTKLVLEYLMLKKLAHTK